MNNKLTLFRTYIYQTLIACSRTEWQCDYGQCISIESRCNGNIDCPDDTSDETHCPSKLNSKLKNVQYGDLIYVDNSISRK